MWSKHPQSELGRTNSGKAIGFHYTEGGEGAKRYNHFDHHDAARLHDAKRNLAAIRSSEYERTGHHGAANGYKKLAQHHAEQSKKHMAKVLPQSVITPVTKHPQELARTSRKDSVENRGTTQQKKRLDVQRQNATKK